MDPESGSALMRLIETCAHHMRGASRLRHVPEERRKEYAAAADQIEALLTREANETTARDFLAIVNPWIERAENDEEIDADLKLIIVEVAQFRWQHDVRAFWKEGFGPLKPGARQ